jgi:hypothetical protein
LQRLDHANGGILLTRQAERVDHEGRVQRDFALQTGLGVLIEELHARSARIEGVDSFRIGGADLRELGREVELVRPLGIFLAEHLTLEGILHAAEVFLAGRIVRSDQVHVLDALLVHVLGDRARILVVGP